ncbi:MAG: metal-sulfur cluster assembly factor [bacterium]|nr:metal-sulfur cluster assembly factor [bacterium]
MSVPSIQTVIEKLQPVMDPEMNISIVDLGLVRGINIDDATGNIDIDLTLTSPMCPMGPEIMAATTQAAMQVPGAAKVHVDLVFAPPWNPRQDATEDGKAALGIWD